uniref:Uncharacterized protein n=1 Tax=Arundo donax TaxID=35708 RepID=A0A0A9H7M3_ARUDO
MSHSVYMLLIKHQWKKNLILASNHGAILPQMNTYYKTNPQCKQRHGTN